MKILTGKYIQQIGGSIRFQLVLMLMFTLSGIWAQIDMIEPMSVGTTASLLSDDKINNIRILSSTDEVLNIEVRYEGYDEEDALYIVSGSVLDGSKKAISAITANPAELSKNAEAVDLSFRMAGNVQSSSPYIESKYISISIQKQTVGTEEGEGDLLDDITKLLGGEDDPTGLGSALSDSFLFSYPKTWRVAGNENMVIDVNLTPIGKASNQ